MIKILILEDDDQLNKTMCAYLCDNGFDAKCFLIKKKTFSRSQLMDEFWGVDTETTLRAVDVYITKLRDKLSSCDGFEIVTVRGLGYKAVLK